MGAIGAKIGRTAGRLLGELGGGLVGGALIPFKKGGKVRKNTKALLHAGEYVLPKGVKPTKTQIRRVEKGKRRK